MTKIAFKIVLVLVFNLILIPVSAQNSSTTASINGIFEAYENNAGRVYAVSKSNNSVKGSVYLFDKWQNVAKIYKQNKQVISLSNINLNLQKNIFESRIYQDSIIAFDLNDIDKVIVNGNLYREYTYEGDTKIFEVIYESETFSILKNSSAKLIESSPDPKLNRQESKYIKKYQYYVKEGDEVFKSRLNKKVILDLVNNDEAKADFIEKHIEKHELLSKQNEDSSEKLKKAFVERAKNLGIYPLKISYNGVTNTKIIEGNKYLFENWKNKAVIHTLKNEQLIVVNMNLNIQRNAFESKVGGETFTYRFNNIEKITIGNKAFKKYYFKGEGAIYEVIYESDKFSLLQNHSLKFIAASVNTMVNQKDRYIRSSDYFIIKNNKIKPCRLKKKSILKALGVNPKSTAKVNAFAKENKLSFKSEEDLKIIFDFIINQTSF
jgi:hypothetical protein